MVRRGRRFESVRGLCKRQAYYDQGYLKPVQRAVAMEPFMELSDLIELIPPVHQRVYRMGLEHLGVVVGEEIDDFSRVIGPR
jgi:hypothetical protein